MTLSWTPARKQKLRELWPSHTAKEISYKLFGDVHHRNAVIGMARRTGCEKKKNPCKKREWDNKLFIRLWENGENPVDMQKIFGTPYLNQIYSHARTLRLKDRLQFPELKRKIYVPPVVPDKPKPQREMIGYCSCGCRAVPGASRCYAWPLAPEQESPHA